MAGSKGNVNAMTHGVCSYLSLGKLPKGCAYIRRQLTAFRRELEAAVMDQCNGEIGIRDAAFVNSAARHEGRCQLLTRYLRGDDCKSLADRLAVLREIGHATDSRDKCIVALGLRRTAEQSIPNTDTGRVDGQEAARMPQRTLFKDDPRPAAPRHRPHVCQICGRRTKRRTVCSRACREAAFDFALRRRATP